MTMTTLREEVKDGIAVLTLHRPDKLNALDYALIDVLEGALDELELDPAVRAVILTGSGSAFSAGADIAEFAGSVEAGVDRALRDFVLRGQRLTRRIEAYTKPLIAAVNGIAFGAGCEITEAAPLAVASERARFAKPEIRLGFPPPFGGTQRLPRLVGRKRALQMILTAEPIDAQAAAQIGLINRVVEHTSLLSEARLLAEEVTRHSPAAVAACLRSVTRGLNVSIDEGLAIEATQFAAMVPTPDIRQGIGAFLSRRKGQGHAANNAAGTP
ncbi:MAG TPA: crotonase/enoyl-CoA hydratase family protein [Myxococcales bacterium]|jgi:enoyl-CoA hydratase/carnithine racemase|nr:crotonase/enoyl-CoA hydratase family protein [Myxococcales bacterium]